MRQDPTCPVCRESLRREELVLCQTCAAPHHHGCWRYNRGCGVYGCRTRTSMSPAGGSKAAIEFSYRRQVSMFALMTLVSGYLLGLFLLLPFIPAELAEGFFVVLSALFASAATLVAAPTALHTRYRLLPERRVVAREVRLGPLVVQRAPTWLAFGQVAGLELQRKEVPRYHRNETGSVLELGLVTADGERVPLALGAWDLEDQLLEKAEAAAELLGTSVRVPMALPPDLALTPQVLACLEPRGGGELAEAPLAELPGHDPST